MSRHQGGVAAPSVNGANNSASETPRVVASFSMFSRLMFCSPTLDRPDVGPVQARLVSERFLRPAPVVAKLPDPGSEAAANVFHAEEFMMRATSPRQAINRQSITSNFPTPILSSRSYRTTPKRSGEVRVLR